LQTTEQQTHTTPKKNTNEREQQRQRGLPYKDKDKDKDNTQTIHNNREYTITNNRMMMMMMISDDNHEINATMEGRKEGWQEIHTIRGQRRECV